jgi:hypothetical protein
MRNISGDDKMKTRTYLNILRPVSAFEAYRELGGQLPHHAQGLVQLRLRDRPMTEASYKVPHRRRNETT